MATNPFELRVIELQAQVNDLRDQIQNTINLRNAAYERQQSWARAGQYDTPEYRAATADYEGAIQRLQVLEPQLRDLQKELERAIANRDRVAEAAAQGVANGMSPEAALEKAVADRNRAEGTKRILTYVGLGLLVLAVVAAIVYFRRKRK